MSFTHGLSTDNYGPYKIIVSNNAATGTHTTLASGLAAASFGDTVFLRHSVVENVTLPGGVNIVGPGASTVTISGTITANGVGSSVISGVKLLTNGANFLQANSSSQVNLIIENCDLAAYNADGFQFFNSDAASTLLIRNCTGDIRGANNIWQMSSPGTMTIENCDFTNSANALVANQTSAGTTNLRNVTLQNGILNTASGNIFLQDCLINTAVTNQVCCTFNGGSHTAFGCLFSSGTADCIQCNFTCVVSQCYLGAIGAGVITGSGNLFYADLMFGGTSTITIATQTPQNWQPYATTNSVAGTSFYDATQFTVTAGFVQLIGHNAVIPTTSFTPTLSGSIASGTITYTNQVGAYSQIGSQVTYHFYMTGTITGVPSGNVNITLPVIPTAAVAGLSQTGVLTSQEIGGGSSSYNLSIDSGNTFLTCRESNTLMTIATGNFNLQGSITYLI